MGRRKDEHYWNQVTREENGTLKCKHCGHKFKGGVSRIKAHVDRKLGRGIAICSIDSDNDDIAHNNDISGSNNSQNATTPLQLQAEGGRETIDDTYVGGGSVNGQSNSDWINLLGGLPPLHDAFERNIGQLNQLVSDLTCEEHDIKKQLQWLESWGKKRKRQVDTWLNKLEGLKKEASVINDLQEIQVGLSEKLIKEVRKHKEEKPVLLSNEFVGKNFEDNVKKMWKVLEDDRVFIVGIHGMGEVGKTFLATHMENEIKRMGTFKHVYWVTVSQDFSIFKLQHDIAEIMDIKLCGDQERTRAAKLSRELEAKEKSVLILDDVWKYIDLEKVGIPLRVNGIKVIITSRLEHVCRQMDCVSNNLIQMFPLSREEAWELFTLKLGLQGTLLTPSAEFDIAKSIVKECDGLPLGITVMARTLKGSPSTWEYELNKLQNMEMGEEMKEEVLFTVLKRSFDNLIEDMKTCFLRCALLPDYTDEEHVIMRLVDSGGLINDKKNFKEIFDEEKAMFHKLKLHSLLLGCSSLRMHGLVRNMAYRLLKYQKCMVKYDRGLTKIPHMTEWTRDLEIASLMRNNIGPILEGTSPWCPRLVTLNLLNNCISHIPECFFRYMNALTRLDLSHNDRLTSLPNSVSNLWFLISLVLSECSKLEYIPPLGQLHALQRLDASGCSILQAPQGLENLLNLKWLDLSRNKSGICELPDLSGLTNMRYLDLRTCSGIKVEDVQDMSMLQCVCCCFYDSNNYNQYMRKIQDGNYEPQAYIFYSAEFDYFLEPYSFRTTSLHFAQRSVRFGDCEELPHSLPMNLTSLAVWHNHQWLYLCSALSSDGPSSLEKIEIAHCTKLQSLFCSNISCSICTKIQNLTDLYLDHLESLTSIYKEDVVGLTQSFSPIWLFSHLSTLNISNCHKLEKLLKPNFLHQIRNLRDMRVSNCNLLNEIFAVSNSDDGSHVELPRLTSLTLSNLPQLKTVCRGILFCGSSEILKIDGCPNIEMLPTIQVLCD